MSDVYEVTSQRQADALKSKPEFLVPFVGKETSVAEAADTLHVPLPRLHYWVQRFVAVGLLRVATVQRRAGRPIKRYTATATRFHVPNHLLGDDATATHVRRATEDFLRYGSRPGSPWPDQWITFDPDRGEVTSQIYHAAAERRGAGTSTAPSHWMRLNVKLSNEEARAMLDELRDVVRRYNGKHANESGLPEHLLVMLQCGAPRDE